MQCFFFEEFEQNSPMQSLIAKCTHLYKAESWASWKLQPNLLQLNLLPVFRYQGKTTKHGQWIRRFPGQCFRYIFLLKTKNSMPRVLANSPLPWKCKCNFRYAVIVKSYICVCVSQLGAFEKNFACSFTAKIVCIHVLGAQTPLSLTKYRSNYNFNRSPVVVSGSSLLPLPRPGPHHLWK